ncbi:CinA family protein [Sphingomonas crocodyli]|uniref:CinA family protein n=1 Tax=Sphingomonas crocodyli TaxID=1979270 RepID=A0A437LYE0_9SPHN|nr:CinA family protein [Sphingomonas crocodyli]RVT90431.1 CinA family protein [Sphingomonas crocodyli]
MSAETLSPAIPKDVEDMAARLLERACDRGVSLATAESCTGGLLSSLLTDIEGASHAFERGFVVYSEEAKCDLLGVSPDLIRRCGAVSAEVARAMATGAVARSQADIAVSVTGFAGAGAPGDEAGLVHFGCADRTGAVRHRVEHFGDLGRGPIRLAAVRVALEMIDRALDD